MAVPPVSWSCFSLPSSVSPMSAPTLPTAVSLSVPPRAWTVRRSSAGFAFSRRTSACRPVTRIASPSDDTPIESMPSEPAVNTVSRAPSTSPRSASRRVSSVPDRSPTSTRSGPPRGVELGDLDACHVRAGPADVAADADLGSDGLHGELLRLARAGRSAAVSMPLWPSKTSKPSIAPWIAVSSPPPSNSESSPAPASTRSLSSPPAITSAPRPPSTRSAPAPDSIVVASASVKAPLDSSMRMSSAAGARADRDLSEGARSNAKSAPSAPMSTCSVPGSAGREPQRDDDRRRRRR